MTAVFNTTIISDHHDCQHKINLDSKTLAMTFPI